MRFLLLLTVILFFQHSLDAQELITGSLYDKVTGEPVPYAKLRILHTNRGTLTNEDGYFEMACTESDTLIISHSLYKEIRVPAIYFRLNPRLALKHSYQQIEEMVVIGSKNELLDLFIDAKENLSKNTSFNSKAYFSLESNAQGTPVELIEAYYNAEINASGIRQMDLKNGRIGMSMHNNNFFVSLNTTNVLSNYSLFKSKYNQLPDNPLHYSKRKLKKHYTIKFLSVENGLHKLHFIPSNEKTSEYLFEAIVWIQKSERRIVRMEFKKTELKQMPFVELNASDRIDSLNFYLTYNFDNQDEKNNLQNIQFHYDFLYTHRSSQRHINSSGAMLFYAPDFTFDLPYYDHQASLFSDYDKIISQPFNAFFWKNNELLSRSKKQEKYAEYFDQNGVLLNYNGLEQINPIFKNKLIPWSEERVLMHQINGTDYFSVSTSSLYSYHSVTTLSELYNFEAFIYLDRNQSESAVDYHVKTLINLEESFYLLEKNKNTLCLINLYFDLVEIERRKLSKRLNSADWSMQQVDSLYKQSRSNLETQLKTFLKDTERGENESAIYKYVQLVREELNVDNSLLIGLEQLVLTKDGEEMERDVFSEVYDYGSALVKIGKYAEALKVLQDLEELGDTHPWLFYNIGVCYLELEDEEKACNYFFKSKIQGEELEEAIEQKCASYEKEKAEKD